MTSLLDIKNAGQFICKDCRISGSTNNLYYFKFNNTDPEESFKNITGNNTDFTETIMGFEPEFTAKVAKLNKKIYEVGVKYYGRKYSEGKKITWKDGFSAIRCILKYNLL